MDTRTTLGRLAALLTAGLVALGASAANATLRTYNLTWSGESFMNSAMATGMITIDDTVLPNPGFIIDTAANVGVTAFMITVSGTGAGNGTFTLGDFSQFYWSTFGGPLDLTMPLIGQATDGDPWGTCYDGSCGEFNIFAGVAGAPNGTDVFEISTDGGAGDKLLLAEFSPKAVPEPGTPALFGLGLAGLGAARRRRTAKD